MNLLKTGQVAERLGVHPDTVKRWVRAGKLNVVKTPGGRNLIPEIEVEKVLTLNALKEEEQALKSDISDIDAQIELWEAKIKALKEVKKDGK
jgi:putative resolvase